MSMKKAGFGSTFPGTRRAPQQAVDVNSLPQIECKCGNTVFVQCMHLRFASRLVSLDGNPTIVQVPQGWMCPECGVPNDFKEDERMKEIFQGKVKEEDGKNLDIDNSIHP